MEKEYKGLKENLERFKNELYDEKTRLLFSIAYKQGYDNAEAYHQNRIDEALKEKQEECDTCGCGRDNTCVAITRTLEKLRK